MCNCRPKSFINVKTNNKIDISRLPPQNFLVGKEILIDQKYHNDEKHDITITNGTTEKSIIKKMRRWNPIILFIMIVMLIGLQGYRICQ